MATTSTSSRDVTGRKLTPVEGIRGLQQARCPHARLELRGKALVRHIERRDNRPHSENACWSRAATAFTRALTRPGRSKSRFGPGHLGIQI